MKKQLYYSCTCRDTDPPLYFHPDQKHLFGIIMGARMLAPSCPLLMSDIIDEPMRRLEHLMPTHAVRRQSLKHRRTRLDVGLSDIHQLQGLLRVSSGYEQQIKQATVGLRCLLVAATR